jgi:antirestriction protein ArdC
VRTLHFLTEKEIKMTTQSNRISVYDSVTNNIISKLEQGIAPWIKPWSCQDAGADRNAISKKEYSGVNRLILGMSGYSSPIWASFKQWQELGGNVKKGEKGTQVVFYSQIAKTEIKPNDPHPENSSYHLLKSYYVFNAEQIEGIEFEQPAAPDKVFNPVPALEDRIIKTGANIKHEGGRAFYNRTSDSITLPEKTAFLSEAHYYATALHELTHWSGAPHRLDRTKGKRFGDTKYAFEELVAEMGAAFLCADYQIQGELQHADYIGNWLQCLKNDNKAIFNAAALAQKAADYINGLDAITGQIAA